MSWWNRILRRHPPDPTAGWRPWRGPLPVFDLAHMCLGEVGFGEPIEAAAFLGRPDRVIFSKGDYCELVYAAGGFQLDFEKGALCYLAFFIDRDEYQPRIDTLRFSRPVVRDVQRRTLQLTPDLDREKLQSFLGAPEHIDVDEEETILYYIGRGGEMEFELGQRDRLKRWNISPLIRRA